MCHSSSRMFGVACTASSSARSTLAPGDVARVHDATRGVPAFAAQVELALLVPGELGSELHQPADVVRSFAHAQLDDYVVAEPGTGA